MERKPISNCWYSEVCNRKEESCELSCLRFKEMSYLMESSGVPKPLQFPKKLEAGVDYEQFVELNSIKNDICNMVDNGYNLYLHSIETGNGKTSWAIRMIQAYLNKIWAKSDLVCRALFIDVPTFLLALKDNISNKNEYIEAVKDNITSADLVVCDDIGAKVGSEFELNHLLSLINTRIMSGKANIYTSNMTPETMNLAIGERLTSRVVNYSNIVNLVGADKRKFAIGGNN